MTKKSGIGEWHPFRDGPAAPSGLGGWVVRGPGAALRLPPSVVHPPLRGFMRLGFRKTGASVGGMGARTLAPASRETRSRELKKRPEGILPMFGKNGPNLPNIGKTSRRADFAFCQALAKIGQICQTLANPSAAPGKHFAKPWQKLGEFANAWQNPFRAGSRMTKKSGIGERHPFRDGTAAPSGLGGWMGFGPGAALRLPPSGVHPPLRGFMRLGFRKPGTLLGGMEA